MPTTRSGAATGPTHEEIAARARQIWIARGEPGGMDLEIWLEAERELAPAGRSPRTTVVEPTSRGVAKTHRGGDKSLTEKVEEVITDRPGVGQGGHAKIVKQTT